MNMVRKPTQGKSKENAQSPRKIENLPSDMNADEYKRLVRLAKNNNVSMEVVLDKFNVAMEEQKNEHIAVNAVVNEYRREKQKQAFQKNKKKSEVSVITGFVIGTRGLWDKAENIRRVAKKFMDEHGVQAAKEQGLIDGDNNILDTRKKIYGRTNPKEGKPLPPNLHILDMMLFGFFRHNGEKRYKYTTLQTGDNRIARGWDKDIVRGEKFYLPCQVPVVIKQELYDEITATSSSAEDTMSTFRGLKEEIDVKAVIDESLGPQTVKDSETGEEREVPERWTPLSKVEAYYEATKDAWDRKAFVKGMIAWINENPDALGRLMIGLVNPDNEDETIRVKFNPQCVPYDFGELSEVYVIGKPDRSKYKDPETKELQDGDVIIDAIAIFAVIKTPRASAQGEQLPEDEIVPGWLE
jgi:hypothetical protein